MNNKNGTRYTKEYKETAIARMMPPNNETIKNLGEELGISEQSLYKWRQKARQEGNATPGNGQTSDRWSNSSTYEKYNV